MKLNSSLLGIMDGNIDEFGFDFEKDIDNKTVKKLSKSKRFELRDVSFIKFNERILNLANDEDIPIGERLKFLAITASNLDEFYMVRIAKTYAKFKNQNSESEKAIRKYELLNKLCLEFTKEQYICYNSLKKEFSNLGYKIIKSESKLTKKGKRFIYNYYKEFILPILNPMVFDNTRPFPLIQNRALNIGVLLEDNRRNYNMFGTIQIPDYVDRLIEIKAKDIPSNERHFMFVEDIVKLNLNEIFINKKIISHCSYRCIRKFDLDVDSTNQNSYLPDTMRKIIKKRKNDDVLKVELSKNTSKEIIQILHKALKINKGKIIKINKGPLDLSFIFKCNIYLNNYEKKKFVYKSYEPQTPQDMIGEYDIFEKLDNEDVLLHHPYESFDTVIDFVNQAAVNPDVILIKQTLYRISGDSPLMKSLIKAAEMGKQVTVLLEIRARSDEQNNLEWAVKLEKAGGHVIYGVEGFKTHCKMCLIVKRNKKGNLKKYVHLSTGNYNDKTAKLYTDLGYLTTNKTITNDVFNLFNVLTGFSEPKLERLSASPFNTRETIVKNIDNEIKNAKNGKEARIIAKFNSLTDFDIVDKLYEASRAGVKIDLIIRGACILKTGIKGYSDNITVRSIVGRFLEHERIYSFFNGGEIKVYISSADLMKRNLDRRFELLIPIFNNKIKKRLLNMLGLYLEDTSAFILNGESYNKIKSKERILSQECFMMEAIKHNKIKNVDKLHI